MRSNCVFQDNMKEKNPCHKQHSLHSVNNLCGLMHCCVIVESAYLENVCQEMCLCGGTSSTLLTFRTLAIAAGLFSEPGVQTDPIYLVLNRSQNSLNLDEDVQCSYPRSSDHIRSHLHTPHICLLPYSPFELNTSVHVV